VADVVAIIPARGGSEGVWKKNLQKVGGVPLIARAVRAAKDAVLVDKVVVSSDDSEILDVAIGEGASIYYQTPEVSGPDDLQEKAILEWLDVTGRTEGTLAMLQCTAPFMTGTDIDGVIVEMDVKEADCCFAACRFQHFIWRHDGSRQAYGINHDSWTRQQRQNRHTEYLEAGSVYAMDIAGFLKHKHRFFGRIAIHQVNPSRVFEIDTYEELLLANRIAGLPEPLSGQRVFVDIDETICETPSTRDYTKSTPNLDAIAEINRMRDRGVVVTYWTARGSGWPSARVEELTRRQMKEWGAEYDYLLFGKPVYDRLYDDKADYQIPGVN